MKSELIKIGKAAKMLGRSIDTLRRWDKYGVLKPSMRINGIRYYSHEAIERFLKGDSSG